MQQAALENKLLQLATGHQLAAALYFATVNKIPDCLKDGPRTAEDIAAAVGLPAGAVYRVLRAMTTSGIFRIQEGRFSLTEIGDLLRTDHARSQRAKVLLAASDLDVWSRLGEAIEREDAIPEVKKDWYLEWGKDEDPIMIFDNAMRSYYFDAPAPLLGVYDFSSINTLVDIGGGDGGHLIEILKEYPDMKGILFEQPETAQRAEGYIRKAGLSGRCESASGDFFKPETIPGNGDAYMMRNIMHCWADGPCNTDSDEYRCTYARFSGYPRHGAETAIERRATEQLRGTLGDHAGMVGYVDVTVVRGSGTHRRGVQNPV